MLEQIITIGFLTTFFSAAVRMAIPLIYAGLGEIFAEKAGILNIGLEGVMLSGAFFAYAGGMFTGNIAIGLLCGMLGGMFISMIHGILSIKLGKDQSVSGIALNMFALGLTSFLYKLISTGKADKQVPTLSTIKIPVLSEIPIIGEGLFHQDILTYIVYALIILTFIFYKKTSLGLSFSSIGESPYAADTAGISVYKYQYISMALNGIFGGLGGAYLILVQLGAFTENITSGRGYIALAAVILGRYSPVGMALAALVFGGASGLQIRLQAMGVPLPAQALNMIPYIITLLALLFFVGKNKKPESLAKPYIRGSR